MYKRIKHALFGLLFLAGCLDSPADPRPLPRDQLDGSLFDARRPQQQPNAGSGYGSGSGSGSGSGNVSGQAVEPDAAADDSALADSSPLDAGISDSDIDAED
ncbi:MAG: hypothetical protein CMH52_12010 [Myxococcales bacterium]|nr:hypothetical protein [Myxococcales bacterium]